MPLESKFTEEQLFDNLISSLVHSIWISLGKIKNPMSDKIERNLFAASMNIDMIDMLFKRMDGNLSEQEETYLTRILRELKLNYIEEKKKGGDIAEEPKKEDVAEVEPKSGEKSKATTKKSSPKKKDKK